MNCSISESKIRCFAHFQITELFEFNWLFDFVGRFDFEYAFSEFDTRSHNGFAIDEKFLICLIYYPRRPSKRLTSPTVLVLISVGARLV